MENVNEKVLADYRLVVSRLDIMKAENTELTNANKKLKKAFEELLEIYQQTHRFDSIKNRDDIEYEWFEKAGILD